VGPAIKRRLFVLSVSLEPLLLELKRLEFLYERTEAGEPTYVFKHALTQEVAYESLLTTRRQALHEVAAEALEVLYAEHLEDAYDRLAYHYVRTDHAVKAVEYLTCVAEKAAQGFAHVEAIAVLQEALEHAERLPVEDRDRCVLDLIIRQSESLHALGRRREIVELFLRHREHLERLQDPLVTGQYYARLGFCYSFLGERVKATESLQHALDAARQSHDTLTMREVLFRLALEGTFAGHLSQAVAYSQEAVTLPKKTEAHDHLSWSYWSYWMLGWSSYFIGDFVQGLGALAQAESVAIAMGDRALPPNAMALSGWTLAAQGNWEAGISACQRALQDSPQAFDTAMFIGMLGYAYLEQGNLTEALPILEQAVEQANEYRSQQIQSWYRTYLGEAYRADGQIQQAWDRARQGLALATEASNPWGAALAQCALGRIAQTSGDLVEAEARLQEALETFASIQARYQLARTHLDLASLAHAQGNQHTATTHLSTAYAWFKKLQVPKWVEPTEQLAREHGVTLQEVELEELPEEPS
jgi:tetratricopeptide (TPR) repeat protein